jgi:hypothetical protein
MSDQLVPRPLLQIKQHTNKNTNIHTQSGIQTRDLSNHAAKIFASGRTTTATVINKIDIAY